MRLVDPQTSIPYNFINLDMAAGELKAEWFKSINPNGRVPAIVHVKEDGTSVKIFESAPCLLYIASEFDGEHKLSYPVGTQEYWTQLSWVSICENLIPSQQIICLNFFVSHTYIAFVASRRLWAHDGPSEPLQPLCD